MTIVKSDLPATNEIVVGGQNYFVELFSYAELPVDRGQASPHLPHLGFRLRESSTAPGLCEGTIRPVGKATRWRQVLGEPELPDFFDNLRRGLEQFDQLPKKATIEFFESGEVRANAGDKWRSDA